MLKKRKQKWSTRLCDRVIVREWVQNKSHHHVYESRTFSKGLTWCKLMVTSIKGRSQKAEIISSLDIFSDDHIRGSQDALPLEHEAH